MSRINLNIVATGDFSQVNRQLDQLRATVAQINARGAGIGISSRDLESVNRAVASYDSLLHSTGAFSRQMVNVQDQTARFGRELESGKLKLSQYFGIWSKGSNESSRSLRELARQQLALENSVVRTDTSKIGKAYVDVPRLMQDAGRGTALARKQQELYNLALYKGGDALINWGKNTQWAGRQLMVGLTIPTVMFGQKAAQAFKEFDQQMTRMIKVYGDGINTTTSAQLEAIRGQVTSLAQDLAGRWGVAMKDTAAMASDLAATGLTGVKLLKATEEATRLATLGEIDRQDAMKATVALQTTFGLSSKELAKSVDFLNATENATSTSLQDLVEAIPRAGTVVKQLGGDYRELTVMMVSMREAGVASGESANAIKSALGALINPTAKTREQFQKFGIDLKNVRDAAGGDPVKMFASLGNELNKLDKISKARLIETLFGKYQFARVSALIDNLGRKGSQTQKVFELMGASAGQLAQNAQSELDRMAQSPSGKFQRALEGFQAKLLPVGEKFLNVATQILEAFGKVFDFLEKHPALQNFVTNIAGLVALVGPVIMLTGVFGNFLGYLVKAFATMKNFGNGFKGFGDIVTAESVAAARAGDLFQASLIDQSEAATILTDALSRLNAELAAYRGNAGGAGPGPINPPNGGGGRPPTRPPGPVILGPNGQPVPPPQPSPLIIPGAPPQTSPALIIPGAPNVRPQK
ncbi:MAG: phage tail tape measure protein [Micrococcales bacterium]|nr:phage tail tape measure protein [Micrococcales bacterium]